MGATVVAFSQGRTGQAVRLFRSRGTTTWEVNMIKRRVSISIDQTDHDRWHLTATLSEPFLRGSKITWRGTRTWTRTLSHPYADDLSLKLLTHWIDALSLVSAGYYEDVELPFD